MMDIGRRRIFCCLNKIDMKFSYRSHPVIEKAENLKLGKIGFYECDVCPELHSLIQTKFKSMWSYIAGGLTNDIKYITEPFWSAFKEAKSNLAKLDSLIDSIEDSNGIIIHGDTAVAYLFKHDQSKTVTECVCFRFKGNALVEYYQKNWYNDDFLNTLSDKDRNTSDDFVWFSNSLVKDGDSWSREDIQREWDSSHGELLLFLAFLKYVEVQTKYLPPKSRLKDINCKYVNETSSHVKVLDSTYFTNLVKSDGFKVRGHFRFQACGPDLKHRKLIWINDFEKHGYTRKAGILQ